MLKFMMFYLINIYWYFMKLFYCLQKCIDPIVKIYNLMGAIPDNFYNIFLIHNSVIINKYNDNNDDIDLSYVKFANKDYDYIVYKKQILDKSLVIQEKTIENVQKKYNEIQPCKYEFLLVILRADKITYDITSILRNDKNYYYVINSVLFDKQFIDWLSIHHLNTQLTNYTISLIDNNMKEINIDSSNYIKLLESRYEVL